MNNKSKLVPNPALYRARWILPISSPPIEDGGVIVRGLSIDEVGRYSEMKTRWPSNAVVDLGDAIILPGLINCHTHLNNSALKDQTPCGGGDMIAWIEAQQKAWNNTAPDVLSAAQTRSWRSLTSLGTIAVANIDHELFNPDNVSTEPLWSLVFYEVRGFNRNRAEKNLKHAEALQAKGAKMVSGVWQRFALSPHGPHSLSPEILVRVAQRCIRRGDVVSMHVAESEEEVGFLYGTDDRFKSALKRWGYWEKDFQIPRCSPVVYLKQLGILTAELMAVHAVHLDDEDINLLASAGSTVCLCPRSNDYIGVGQPRVGDMLRAGIRTCLGSDGPASNDTLSIFDEMAFLRSRHPHVSPADVLRMATLNGAEALRIDSLLGSLEINKVGRFLVYRGDIGNDPVEAITSGIDVTMLEWSGGEIDLRK
jgi:cytosine/adenosine deaminase-related metal-dependent hydrolase